MEPRMNKEESRTNPNNERDFRIIYENDMGDEGYFNNLTEKKFNRLQENA